MARPQKFTTDQILDAALTAVQQHGPAATMADVARAVGAPMGSMYYRFPSREHLFIALWLRSIRHFHAGLLEALTIEDPRTALVAAARHIPRFCRAHPDVALALTLYRQTRLVQSAPAELVEEVRTINEPVLEAMARACTRRFGRATPKRLDLVRTACQASPYGLVRPYVGGPVPLWLDAVVTVSTEAILALGDPGA